MQDKYQPHKRKKKMKHRPTKYCKGSIVKKCESTGLSIEETIRQAIASNSPIDGNTPPIYTPSKDGVIPAYNIRTDKHDLALEAMDKYQKSDAMKGFINQVEYGKDKDGNPTDDKGQVIEQLNV